MRRIASCVVILILVAALASPLAEIDFAAAGSAPMCCLGEGKHKCLGDKHGSGEKSSEGFSRADETCPHSPLALAAIHSPELARPITSHAIIVASRRISVALATTVFLPASEIFTRSERGPPSLSFS
jgi:hypothetical protein